MSESESNELRFVASRARTAAASDPALEGPAAQETARAWEQDAANPAPLDRSSVGLERLADQVEHLIFALQEDDWPEGPLRQALGQLSDRLTAIEERLDQPSSAEAIEQRLVGLENMAQAARTSLDARLQAMSEALSDSGASEQLETMARDLAELIDRPAPDLDALAHQIAALGPANEVQIPTTEALGAEISAALTAAGFAPQPIEAALDEVRQKAVPVLENLARVTDRLDGLEAQFAPHLMLGDELREAVSCALENRTALAEKIDGLAKRIQDASTPSPQPVEGLGRLTEQVAKLSEREPQVMRALARLSGQITKLGERDAPLIERLNKISAQLAEEPSDDSNLESAISALSAKFEQFGPKAFDSMSTVSGQLDHLMAREPQAMALLETMSQRLDSLADESVVAATVAPIAEQVAQLREREPKAFEWLKKVSEQLSELRDAQGPVSSELERLSAQFVSLLEREPKAMASLKSVSDKVDALEKQQRDGASVVSRIVADVAAISARIPEAAEQLRAVVDGVSSLQARPEPDLGALVAQTGGLVQAVPEIQSQLSDLAKEISDVAGQSTVAFDAAPLRAMMSKFAVAVMGEAQATQRALGDVLNAVNELSGSDTESVIDPNSLAACVSENLRSDLADIGTALSSLEQVVAEGARVASAHAQIRVERAATARVLTALSGLAEENRRAQAALDEKLSRFANRLGEPAESDVQMTSALATIQAAVLEVQDSLATLESRPLPAPDMRPQREMMARLLLAVKAIGLQAQQPYFENEAEIPTTAPNNHARMEAEAPEPEHTPETLAEDTQPRVEASHSIEGAHLPPSSRIAAALRAHLSTVPKEAELQPWHSQAVSLCRELCFALAETEAARVQDQEA